MPKNLRDLNLLYHDSGGGSPARPLPAKKTTTEGKAIGSTASKHGEEDKALRIRNEIARLESELHTMKLLTAPKLILPELHDSASGRIDAQKVAEFMRTPLKQLSEGLGLNYKAVHRSPAAAGCQESLRPVKRALELLHEFFGSVESIRIWLNTPHPDLEGSSALQTILDGRAGAVTLILDNAWNGIPV